MYGVRWAAVVGAAGAVWFCGRCDGNADGGVSQGRRGRVGGRGDGAAINTPATMKEGATTVMVWRQRRYENCGIFPGTRVWELAASCEPSRGLLGRRVGGREEGWTIQITMAFRFE